MLQLPHMEMDVIRKLSRKQVRSLADLLDLETEKRLTELHAAGALLKQFQPRLVVN
jgi:hypothetical protein